MNDKMESLRAAVVSGKCRSAWDKGVKAYAVELVKELADNINGGWLSPDVLDSRAACKLAMLNGARDWSQYSWGGCSLCYDADIAKRLCTPSEYRKRKGGAYRPNCYQEWLDVQAVALEQACNLVLHLLRDINAKRGENV